MGLLQGVGYWVPGDLETWGPGTWGPGHLGTWGECYAHAGREGGGGCAGGCKSPVLSFGADKPTKASQDKTG